MSCCAAIVVIAWHPLWTRWMRGWHKEAMSADVRPSNLPPALDQIQVTKHICEAASQAPGSCLTSRRRGLVPETVRCEGKSTSERRYASRAVGLE